MYRSFLFAPGNHARKVLKVFGCGADNVILDLEDAVAKAEKVATRVLVVEALKRPRGCGAYIRVNAFSTEFCYGDAVAVVGPGLDGIILPMVIDYPIVYKAQRTLDAVRATKEAS